MMRPGRRFVITTENRTKRSIFGITKNHVIIANNRTRISLFRLPEKSGNSETLRLLVPSSQMKDTSISDGENMETFIIQQESPETQSEDEIIQLFINVAVPPHKSSSFFNSIAENESKEVNIEDISNTPLFSDVDNDLYDDDYDEQYEADYENNSSSHDEDSISDGEFIFEDPQNTTYNGTSEDMRNALCEQLCVNIQKPVCPQYALKNLRDKTFISWPKKDIVNPKELSYAGFFFSGNEDLVRCFSCGGYLQNWKEGKDPCVQHAKYYPNCAFLKLIMGHLFVDTVQEMKKQHKITVAKIQAELGSLSDYLGSLIAKTPNVENPKHPEFEDLLPRIMTFKSWPANHIMRSAELSVAGFYFTGDCEKIACFHCGGVHQYWEEGDKIWVLHAKCFPKCELLCNVVGQQYVDIVQDLKKIHQITLEKVKAKMTTLPSCLEEKLNKMALKQDPSVIPVIQLGYKEEDVVKTALYLRKEGEVLTSEKLFSKMKEQMQCDSYLAEFKSESKDNNSQGQICSICSEKAVKIATLPCGHLVSCLECSFGLRNCPVCHTIIKGTLKVFFS